MADSSTTSRKYSILDGVEDGIFVRYVREDAEKFAMEGNCPGCHRVGFCGRRCSECQCTVEVVMTSKCTGFYVNPWVIAYLGSSEETSERRTQCDPPPERMNRWGHSYLKLPFDTGVIGRSEFNQRPYRFYWIFLQQGEYDRMEYQEVSPYFRDLVRRSSPMDRSLG